MFINKTIKGNKKTLAFPVIISIALLAAFITSNYIIGIAFVYGNSMEPSYHNNGVVLVSKLSVHKEQLKAGDVIVFRNTNISRHPIIKRVVAVPGDHVEIINGVLFVNKCISPLGISFSNDECMSAVVLGDDCYFVLGDNPEKSIDSRSPEFGTVEQKNIIGKVIASLF